MRLRNFIDSYEFYLLLEATKYDGMFSAVTQLTGKDSTQIINWARQTLQREDRIIWFLRWYRLMHLKIVISWANEQHPDYQPLLKLYNKYANEMAKFTGKPVQLDRDALRSLQGELSHYLSLPIPGIQNLQFTNQTVEDLIAQMKQAEEQWKQENSSNEQYLEPQEGDQIVIPFNDGWAWWLLDRMYCSAEGKAMGHCGNAGSPQPGDRILSLRKQTARGWRPSLTFILKENGMLGEMKGRNNDKPQPDYHPYIVTLLQNDMVKGIVGGGYLPESNFAMEDLPEEQQNQLSEMKPGLATASYIYKKFGPTPEFVEKMISKITSATDQDIEWDDAHKLFVVGKYNSAVEFIDDYGDGSMQDLNNAFNGNNDMFIDLDYDPDDNSAANLFDDLPHELQMQICVYAQNTYGYGFSDDDEDIDWQDTSDVWRVLIENDDGVVQTLKNAISTGMRYGAEAQAYNAFIDALKDPFPNNKYLTPHYTMYTNQDGTEHIQMDGPCSLTITPEEAISISESQVDLEDIAYYGWINSDNRITVEEPHYGWSNYDEKAAIEQATDELSQIG